MKSAERIKQTLSLFKNSKKKKKKLSHLIFSESLLNRKSASPITYPREWRTKEVNSKYFDKIIA